MILKKQLSWLEDSCYEKAKKIIREKRKILDEVAKQLLEKETLYEEEFKKLVNPKV